MKEPGVNPSISDFIQQGSSQYLPAFYYLLPKIYHVAFYSITHIVATKKKKQSECTKWHPSLVMSELTEQANVILGLSCTFGLVTPEEQRWTSGWGVVSVNSFGV